ncbi:MAG TPA: hypothetical protein VK815_18445 [Candidatus Acidoferrales bacterium]|jgi:hypothetical protein|nr:hypothetical protein [Candidatus Acidoferrales bacterium]
MNQEPPKKSGAQLILKIFAAAVIIVMAAVSSLAAWLYFSTPKIVADADAGFRKAKQTIDPEKLRAWALESITRWPDTNGSQKIPDSEIPEYLHNLYPTPPEDAFVTGGVVSVFWGGGFFHWVIEVGPTNYVSGERSEYQTVEWTNGIYYSHEGNRKIK